MDPLVSSSKPGDGQVTSEEANQSPSNKAKVGNPADNEDASCMLTSLEAEGRAFR